MFVSTPHHRRPLRGLSCSALLLAGIVLACPGQTWADARAFTFTYETTTMPAGEAEYEQWVTWKTHKEEDASFDRIDFRHEIEFGVTDNFQLAFYLSDWRYQDGDSVEHDGTDWRGAGVEAIYSFTDPVTDPLGIAIYGEFIGGDELMKVEGKLLLQKNIGQFVFAWNGIIEAEWENKSYSEDTGEFGQTLGISYQVHPSFLLGFEAVHEIEYADWEEWEDHVVYVGPNASYRAKKWWVTVTPLFQVTDVDGEADFQTRLLLGVFF